MLAFILAKETAKSLEHSKERKEGRNLNESIDRTLVNVTHCYSTIDRSLSPDNQRMPMTQNQSIKLKKFRKNLLESNKFLPKKVLKALQFDIDFGEITEEVSMKNVAEAGTLQTVQTKQSFASPTVDKSQPVSHRAKVENGLNVIRACDEFIDQSKEISRTVPDLLNRVDSSVDSSTVV